MRLTVDPATKTLVLDFGKPVAWIGFGRSDAIQLAELLMKRALELPPTSRCPSCSRAVSEMPHHEDCARLGKKEVSDG
jgi:hypothetical protein